MVTVTLQVDKALVVPLVYVVTPAQTDGATPTAEKAIANNAVKIRNFILSIRVRKSLSFYSLNLAPIMFFSRVIWFPFVAPPALPFVLSL